MANLTVEELDRLASDTGCRLHDNCLTCPRSKCIYDEIGVDTVAELRYRTIRSMASSHSVESIAKQLGISVRTVHRALKEQ